MKRILNLPALLLVAMASMFLYSCSDDPVVGGGGTDVKPTVTLTTSSDITVDPVEVFTIDITASKGDSPLETVTVYEDGTTVPFSRMTYDGVDASANPALLFGTEMDGLTRSIGIEAQSSAATTVAFEVEVEDVAGEKASVFVNVTTVGTPPSLTTTSPTTVTTGQDIKNGFKLTAVKGSGDLVSIEVRENNQFVDKSNIFWKEISMSVADNPFALAEEDQGGFDKLDLFIMTPASEGNFIYTVLITDEFGLTAQLQFDVTTLPSVTALEMREDVTLDRLLNSGGGQNTGGLDLDTGMSTNSDDPDAEIKDNGLDDTLPPGDNWLRTISPIKDNDVSMKYLIASEGGLPEGFTFAGVEFKEDLPDLFNNGVELVDDVSNRVEIEDVFIVSRDGNYWILEVIEIVDDPNNNVDSYKFDVKY